MGLIRTVVVDDSAFVRKTVREMLSRSPAIEVVGLARNGEDALQMVEALQPDVVTCDLLMPELDGVGFVRKQMARKGVPIIILTASPQDAERVLEALEAGAVDFLQKPTALANQELLGLREELIGKIKAAAHARAGAYRQWPRGAALPTAMAGSLQAHQRHPGAAPVAACGGRDSRAPSGSSGAADRAVRVDVVVLGISTGGPQALRYLLPQMASDFPVPLVIVLHMPVGYTAAVAESLAGISRLQVQEAFEGCPVQAGAALLAPAGRHLSFERTPAGQVSVRLSLEPRHKPHRPSVDVLFQSAAEIYGQRVLAVVMTGMGDDGLKGAAQIKAQGGTVLTQSEESCVVYGMPRSVVESGLSDGAVALSVMAQEISKRV